MSKGNNGNQIRGNGAAVVQDCGIGIVVSRFNEKITQGLLEGAEVFLREQGVREEQITCVHVPGALEIPVTLQALGEQQCFDGFIALGAVIKGETHHYEYVCESVTRGCSEVSLKLSVPVMMGVLTVQNWELALARISDDYHMGREAAQGVLEMISVFRQLKRQ